MGSNEVKERPVHRAVRALLAGGMIAAAVGCFAYYGVVSALTRAASSGVQVWLLGGVLLLLWSAVLGVTAVQGRRLPWRASVRKTAVGLFVAVVLLLGFLELCVLSQMNAEPAEEPDYLLVPGALVVNGEPSDALRARIDSAAAYLLAHPRVQVLCSGGTSESGLTEAACIRRELVARGIEPERILTEEASATTSENFRAAASLLPRDAAVCVVTNSFHVFRCRLYARQFGFTQVSGLAAPFGGPLTVHYLVRELMAVVHDVLFGRLPLVRPMSGEEAAQIIMELLGTAAFAVSGAVVGLRRRMDLFGVVALGMTTAVGGGLIRDVLLGRSPGVFSAVAVASTAILWSVIVFLPPVRRWLAGRHRFYEWILLGIDSLGLGIFTAVGVGVTRTCCPDASVGMMLFLGMMTGVGGGVLRDIFAGETPYVFVKHIYAVASLAGAAVCIGLEPFSGRFPAMLACTAFVVLLRVGAARWRWNLPRCREGMPEVTEGAHLTGNNRCNSGGKTV